MAEGAVVDKVVIVTGASRGIGAATARLAAKRGFAVCVNGHRSEEDAAAVVRDIEKAGGQAFAVTADVGREADVLRLFEAVDRRFGRLDGLVCNAGIAGRRAPVAELSVDDIEGVLRTNLVGTFLCAREAVRRMASGRGGRGGAIVAVSSQAAQFGGVRLTPYAASKAALNSFVVGFAREVAADGIRVNAVSPGVIDTDQHRGIDEERRRSLTDSLPMGRFGSVDEVAEAIVWLLSDAASYVSGAVLPVHGAR